MDCLTAHTYPELLFEGGRLALTRWKGPATCRQVVAAVVGRDPEAIIARARGTDGEARGCMPGGLGLG